MGIKATKSNLKEILNQILLKTHILPFITAARALKVLELDFGHFSSAARWESVDKNGQPIPWFSYSAIEYLRSLDLTNKSVFEYGSGNSTLFWAKHTAKIKSVESDIKWFNLNLKRLKVCKNAQLTFENNKVKYVDTINITKAKYDIIVIDGDSRFECSLAAIGKLKNGGFIILDNSEWFPKITKYLREHNLIEIDFSGFGPINPYTTTTSIFISREFKPQINNKTRHPGAI